MRIGESIFNKMYYFNVFFLTFNDIPNAYIFVIQNDNLTQNNKLCFIIIIIIKYIQVNFFRMDRSGEI